MSDTKMFDSPLMYFPELKEHYLEALSREMLKVVEMTLSSHNTPYDDNYTVETSIFGRTRQLFLELSRNQKWQWLSVASKGMDYVPKLCGLPVRVFKDDPISPRKQKIFFKNDCEQHQLSLLFENEETIHAGQLTWRLFIQDPATVDFKGDELEDIEDDYRVVLVGYNLVTKEIQSMWQSKAVANITLHSVDTELPVAKPITRKTAIPKEDVKEVAKVNGK